MNKTSKFLIIVIIYIRLIRSKKVTFLINRRQESANFKMGKSSGAYELNHECASIKHGYICFISILTPYLSNVLH